VNKIWEKRAIEAIMDEIDKTCRAANMLETSCIVYQEYSVDCTTAQNPVLRITRINSAPARSRMCSALQIPVLLTP
jgi:hypothetical protein